jgi:hypothetical protein
MNYSRSEMDSLNFEDDSLENVLLKAGDRMSDAAYESYTVGRLDRNQLKEVYELLSRWTAESQRLLEIMT